VWNIGIEKDWDTPDHPGSLGRQEVDSGFRRVSGLITPAGTSGGAAVTVSGVIGIVHDDGGMAAPYTRILPIERIIDLFRDWEIPVNQIYLPVSPLPAAPLLSIPAGFSASDFRIPDLKDPPACEPMSSAPPEAVPLSLHGLANVALLKQAKASASSVMTEFPHRHQIDNLIDGWYNNCRSWIPARKPWWIEIDLGEVFEIGSVSLGSEHTKYWGDRALSSFSISTRADRSSDWDLAYQHGPGAPPILETNNFPFPKPRRAQYVRVDINATNDDQPPRLDEVEIYARKN